MLAIFLQGLAGSFSPSPHASAPQDMFFFDEKGEMLAFVLQGLAGRCSPSPHASAPQDPFFFCDEKGEILAVFL